MKRDNYFLIVKYTINLSQCCVAVQSSDTRTYKEYIIF